MSEHAPLPREVQTGLCLVRLPDVMDRVGLKRSAIYQRMSEGRFPQSRPLGPRCVVWVESETDSWIGSIVAMKAGSKGAG